MCPNEVVVLVLRIAGLVLLSVFCGDNVTQSLTQSKEARRLGLSDARYWSRAAVFFFLAITNSLIISGLLAVAFYRPALSAIEFVFPINSIFVLLSLAWHYILRLK